MRVLVTGGSGKAGAYVVRALAEAGHDLVHVDQTPPREALPGTFIKAALTDSGAVYDVIAQTRPDALCHVAANPAPEGDPRQQVFANNVLSTYHVFQAAGDFAVKRFVYASSEMATGWLTTDQLPARFPFDETDRVDTPNAYALSKYLGEVIADSMTRRYPDTAIVSLRINNVITPETYPWLDARRADYPAGGSGNFWSYIDARDVATAFVAAVDGATSGHEVYLIAAADTCLDTPTRQALRDRFGEAVLERISPELDEYASVFDCRKIARALGWRAQHSWRDNK
jgi:nucleoside-diphosphate-sugar epimerase